MKPTPNDRRRGFSLLELTVTMGLMATLLTSVFVLLRTAQNTWVAHDTDHARLESAHGVARHLVRELRQAEEITVISTSDDTTGNITALMTDGSTHAWSLSGNEVTFAIDGSGSTLANQISELRFVGYRADGVTATTTASEVQAVEIFVTVDLDRDANSEKTIHTWAWLRIW